MSMGTVRPLCPPIPVDELHAALEIHKSIGGGQASLTPTSVEVGPWLSVRPLTPVDKLHAVSEIG